MPKRKAIDYSVENEEIPNAKKKAVPEDKDNVVACELSKTRKVVVKKFKEKVFVDIREFYNKDGLDLLVKKGILLPLDQWDMLKSHFTGVQELIANLI